MWFQIISELLVNLSAGWFGAAFIETQLYPIESEEALLSLTVKVLFGMLTLLGAKFFREKAGKRS